MNYKQSLEYIESLSGYGIVPGLDSIKALCAKLGNPQDELRFIHIAGTNGKGSTLCYVSTILKCAGYRVGRYISPAISDYREKIQINGRPITQKSLCDGIELVKDACDRLVEEGKPHPTPFEVETALAFWYYKEQKCDYVVLETGMGGLEDATNLIRNTEVAVLASISMDHMQFLGKTLGEIARQKAGIIKKGCTVVSLKQQPEAMQVVSDTAKKMGCELRVADPGKAEKIRYGLEKQVFDYGNYKKMEISLAGSYQIENAVLAIDVVEALRSRNAADPDGYSAGAPNGAFISDAALRQGLKEAEWYGRFSVLSGKPLFVVDGAHNEDAARKLAASIEFYFTNKRIIYIIGILKDKEYDKIIGLTAHYADQIITVTPPDNPRALHAYELAREISKVHGAVTAADSLEEAVEMSYMLAGKDDVILAFGSLSYLGKLREIVEKRSEKGGSHGKSGKDQRGGKASSGRNR